MSKINIVFILGCLLFISPLPAETQKELALIDNLMSSAKYEEALNETRRLRQTLPSSEWLTAWELDFQGEVWCIANGRECLYYQLHLSNSAKDAPGRKDALESITANFAVSDLKFAIVCVELKTGKIRWSRNVNGIVYLAVDPQTDVLYLYNERVLTLSPDSGKVIELYIPPEKNNKIRGLLLGQVIAIPQISNTIALDVQLSLYEPGSKTIRNINAGDYWLLAPNEKSRLVPTNSGWDCIHIPDGYKLWSLQDPISSHNAPLWRGVNPTFVTGTEYRRGTVTSIDMSTGKPLWFTVMGWGTYESHLHRTTGSGYPNKFIPLTALNEYLLSLDGSGRLYFMDPADGRITTAPQLARDFQAMPFQYNGQLIVSSSNWVRSYSIANLIKPDASLDASLQIREARCLLSLGRQKEALTLLDRLVERTPQLKAAWNERADVCKALNNTEEETFSRCQALSLSGQTTDEILRNRWGLLRLYNLNGKPCWPLIQMNNRVYTGTLAGDLWNVQPDNLNIELTARLDHEITSLATQTELQAVLGNSTLTRKPIPQKPASVDNGIPREWYTQGGERRISEAVSYQGRQFRTMIGGIRILSGIEITELPTLLNDINGPWRIHISPSGPLGYGAGVFELNDNLQPSRWLIRPAVNGECPDKAEVIFIQNTSKTIGLIISSSNGAVLQVYSRQGVLLNEAPLGPWTSGWATDAQLISMGNGYLFSDRQLVWAGAGKDRRVWKFGPSLARTSNELHRDQWRYFGDPLLLNDCLYVTGLDGQLYIFDSTHITGSGE